LDRTQPDAITLAGSGEPTLNTQIDQAISAIKEMTPIQVAILTNGSLLWREDVLNRILEADIIMPTLTTVFQDTFTAIHRPHPDLHLPTIIKGFKKLRNAFSGHIYMEVVLLAGFNDSDQEIEGLHDVLTQISPDKIQLNTVVRPPADPHARPLDPQQLETIKTFLGEKAEIIVHTPRNQEGNPYLSQINTVLEMAKRRPVRASDIAQTLNQSIHDVENLLDGLLIKGDIQKQEFGDECFYVSK
jgi:wyosine [tRNA(Phe)-imidazoG37] synthetase (radical SAM superfamily)